MKHFIFFLLILFSAASFAQDKPIFAISGSVKDAFSKKPIDGATITIVKAKDSSLVKITYSDKDGNFFFENLSSGTYRILSTAVGYKKKNSPLLIIEGTNINLAAISLNTEFTSLKEVMVVSKKSFIERKIDKTVINVEASILNAGGTAMDILEAAPGVSVDREGNISLQGKVGVNIMIDGKPACKQYSI